MPARRRHSSRRPRRAAATPRPPGGGPEVHQGGQSPRAPGVPSATKPGRPEKPRKTSPHRAAADPDTAGATEKAEPARPRPQEGNPRGGRGAPPPERRRDRHQAPGAQAEGRGPRTKPRTHRERPTEAQIFVRSRPKPKRPKPEDRGGRATTTGGHLLPQLRPVSWVLSRGRAAPQRPRVTPGPKRQLAEGAAGPTPPRVPPGADTERRTPRKWDRKRSTQGAPATTGAGNPLPLLGEAQTPRPQVRARDRARSQDAPSQQGTRCEGKASTPGRPKPKPGGAGRPTGTRRQRLERPPRGPSAQLTIGPAGTSPVQVTLDAPGWARPPKVDTVHQKRA